MPQTPDVTIMFTDVVGSTELLDRLGDELGSQVLRRHLAALRASALRHGGEVVKSLGDGVMIAFADAGNAVACAAAMQRELQCDPVTDSRSRRLRMRVGIHRGAVMRDGDDCFGKNVVIASRLCDSCPADEVLISAQVRSAVCGDLAPSHDRAAMTLRGIGEPVHAARLIWQLTAEHALQTAGVGSRIAVPA